MLTETVVIFSVLLGLLILISVLGGSVLPLENFADEVVIDEQDDAPAREPARKAAHAAPAAPAASSHMSAKEMEELAMSLAALPSDEEREAVMEPMSDEVKNVLAIMLKGMGVGAGAGGAEGFSVVAKKHKAKEPFMAGKHKKEHFTDRAEEEEEMKEHFMANKHKKEHFMAGKHKKEHFTAGKHKKEHFTQGPADDRKKEHNSGIANVEPFDGEVYAMY